jgi:hypothetical protein
LIYQVRSLENSQSSLHFQLAKEPSGIVCVIAEKRLSQEQICSKREGEHPADVDDHNEREKLDMPISNMATITPSPPTAHGEP